MKKKWIVIFFLFIALALVGVAVAFPFRTSPLGVSYYEGAWVEVADGIEAKVRVAVTVTPPATPTPTPTPETLPGIVIPDAVDKVDGYGDYSHVQPGDRLLIPSSRTAPITFKNLRGEEGNPIVITNYGGKVRIDASGNWVGIQLRNCEHIRLTGTGDLSIEYGFEIFNVTNCGITTNVGEGSRYLEIDHVEVHDSDGGGIRSGKARGQIRETWRGVGFHIHHNYVHDIVNEGFYIGSSHWGQGEDPEIEGVEITYNRVERCGHDGIQVGSAVEDVKVHHNYLRDVGLDLNLGGGNTSTGLVINQGTTGDWYNNIIINAGTRGIMVQGIGGYRIHNNVILNSGVVGIRWFGGSGLFYDNAILGGGIKASFGAAGAFYGNVVAGGIDVPAKVEMYGNMEVE